MSETWSQHTWWFFVPEFWTPKTWVWHIYPWVCGQPANHIISCFGMSFSSCMGLATTTTTYGTNLDSQSAVRRASSSAATARHTRGVRSLHIHQHCARIETYLLKQYTGSTGKLPSSMYFLKQYRCISSKAVPKGMQSLAPKSFLREWRAEISPK
jgi:hypothetical protein